MLFLVNMERPRDTGTEALVLTAAGLVVGVGTALWAAAVAGGWLWHGRVPDVTVGSAPGLALGVLSRPGSPASAWPDAVRPLLPPAWALYALTAAVLTAEMALAAVTGRLVRDGRASRAPYHGPRSGRGLPARSAWARRRDLAALRIAKPEVGRLTLGRGPGHWWHEGTLVAGEARSSLIVLGPSQSGKTSGLAVPAILEWAGPVLATSVKTDLVRDTLAWRQRLGPAWVFDPTASTALVAATWSPLARCRDWQTARQVATWLCGAARSKSGSMGGDEDFWYAAAAKLLAPHLLAAATSGRTVADVVRWIDTQDEEEVALLLDQAGVDEATQAVEASWRRDERTRSSIYATAEMVLEAFADPTVVASARTSEIRPDVLVSGGSATLYVCAPSHEQDRLRPVFVTLIHEVLAAVYTKVGRQGRPLHPPLLVVLDEAANIAPLGDLDTLASTAAGQGVQLVTVWQDLAQIQARYGERAATVVNNHRAKIFLSGVSDPSTLDYASRLLGDGDVGDATVTTDQHGGRSTTRAQHERRLLTDAELRRLRPQEGILVYGHLQPARIRLRPWFRDRQLRARVQPLPPA
jgi:type IV secretion system protein VirD4